MRGQIRAGTVTLRHIQTLTKGGRVYRYLRIPGQPRVRLPDLPPDDPAFLAAYAEAMRGAESTLRAPAGTIAAVIEAYMRSAGYKSRQDADNPAISARYAVNRHRSGPMRINGLACWL